MVAGPWSSVVASSGIHFVQLKLLGLLAQKGSTLSAASILAVNIVAFFPFFCPLVANASAARSIRRLFSASCCSSFLHVTLGLVGHTVMCSMAISCASAAVVMTLSLGLLQLKGLASLMGQKRFMGAILD